jgi:Na+/H+-dicarboxylate symporter
MRNLIRLSATRPTAPTEMRRSDAHQPDQRYRDRGGQGHQGRARNLALIIFIGMLLGIAVGYACHELWPDPQTAKTIAGYISLFTDIFLRLIKMIIAPLVFTTLVVGVAHMGDTKSVGRRRQSDVWFISASLVSLLLGLIMVRVAVGRHRSPEKLSW